MERCLGGLIIGGNGILECLEDIEGTEIYNRFGTFYNQVRGEQGNIASPRSFRRHGKKVKSQ